MAQQFLLSLLCSFVLDGRKRRQRDTVECDGHDGFASSTPSPAGMRSQGSTATSGSKERPLSHGKGPRAWDLPCKAALGMLSS